MVSRRCARQTPSAGLLDAMCSSIVPRDQARPAAKRQVLETPLNEYLDAALEFDDVHQVDKQPYQPRGKAGKVKSEDIGDGGGAADDRHVSLVEIVERPRLGLPFDAGADDLRGIGAALHCNLGYAGQRLALRPRRQRQVAYHKNVRIVWHGELRRYQDAADAIGLGSYTLGEFPAELVHRHSTGPEDGFRV